MSGQVIDGPWHSRQSDPTTEEVRDLQERARIAAKATPDLLDWVRMPDQDAERAAKNLGDIIAEVARDLGRTEKRVLADVFGPEKIAKRLRYARLPSDEGLKTDEFAKTFRDFHAYAKSALDLRGVMHADILDSSAEALLRLVEGTSRDLVENRMRRIDIDAARAVADLATAFIRRLEKAVPGLRAYFELLAKHQLFHLPFEESVWKERFRGTLRDWERGQYPAVREDIGPEWPLDLDTTRFVATFTGHHPAGSGPANTVPSTYTYDGMWLGGGDGDANGMAGLLPRIHLGDIHRHGVACKEKALWGSVVTDWTGAEAPAGVHDVIRCASANPTRVYLVVAPVLEDQSVALALGLIEEEWPFGTISTDENGRRHLLVREWYQGGDGPVDVWGPLMSWPHAGQSYYLSLIPGESAKRQLGLRGLSGIDQLADEITSKPASFDDLTDEYLRTSLFDVRAAIQLGSGFTDFPSDTLGAALVSNLLYVSGSENALEMMIADARSRVETLDRHMASWRREYAHAKAAFETGAGGIASDT